MKQLCVPLLIVLAILVAAAPKSSSPFTGRWDLTITTVQGTYPSWMELLEEDGKPAVRVQGRVSSVHPVQDMKLDGSHLSFTTSEWFGKPIPVSWELTVAGGKISGIQKRSDGVEGQIAGVPAPLLNRKMPMVWKAPEMIFNGKDLTGWEADEPSANHWKAQDGELVNEKAGANIRTTAKFQDYRLHVEFNCPQDGNSGVYMRGRYEVQVEYEPANANDKFHAMGSIYGFLAPAVEMSKRPGEWESFDVTLVGRTVTVIRNGVLTIDAQEIPGITGGAVDSREAEPGPLYIQGDHTGGMKYRNITISVPAR
ncbi:MAG TPA: DUF1080 domain-containing protein [Bryobacteraceae bacterium]|nr:DUF1080 domain-containing protein [Bryobacteraceae bacterium]